MYEIEIKAKIDSLDKIERKIVEKNATFLKMIEQIDYYYNHPCRDFKKTDEALRIRYENDEYFITYKGPKIDLETKSRKEIEVKSEKNILEILENLGFKLAGKVKKIRKIYKLNDLEICLDNVENLGYFIEIETFGNLEKGKEKILELAKSLGLNNLERRSYFELLGD
ncbi:MAG: class IV adenylate cyclase [Thermoplasmata archaeon]|nr:class IV adenylate cyclase [Thermoplasmata archaeon]